MTKHTPTNTPTNMHLSVAYSLLVQQELHQNKKQFDALATAMELLAKDEDKSRSVYDSKSVSAYENRTVVDLTLDDNLSVAEFVNLTKDPEVFELCSSLSSLCSSASSLSSTLMSAIMPRGLLKHGVNGSTDSDISSTSTGGHPGLPQPRLIGTSIKFKEGRTYELCKQQEEESASLKFFLLRATSVRNKRPLDPEHPDCSMGLKENQSTKKHLMEKQLTVSPETPAAAFHTTNCKNLCDLDRTAIKDHLLLCCTPSPTDCFKLPLGTTDVTAKKYSTKNQPTPTQPIWTCHWS